MTPTSMSLRALLVAGLSLLAGCEGEPGRSELEAYASESGQSLWSQTLPTERFAALPSPTPGVLRVQGYDRCGGSGFLREHDRQSGAVLRDLPQEPSATSAPPLRYDPPSPCPSLPLRRVTLEGGRLVDLCNEPERALIVRDVAGGTQLFRLAGTDYVTAEVSNDGLLASTLDSHTLYALADGAKRWSRARPSEFTHLIGSDRDRVYFWDEPSGSLFALAFADGTPVWQTEGDCGWASHTDSLVICGRMRRKSTCEE